MTTLRDDVRYAARTLRKSPAFTIAALVTIALGIGASTAIFSVVNGVLLRPLPYPEPDRLAFVQSDLTARDVQDFPMPPGDLPDLRSSVNAFQEVAAVVTGRNAFTTETGDAELATVANVTTNFFRTLGARISRGRDFVEADGVAPPPPPQNQPAGQAPAAPAQPAIVILSHEFWQRRFGADPGIIGKTFRMGQQTAEIVGILEPGFELLWPETSGIATRPEIYSALRIDFGTASRVNVFLRTVGRLASGANLVQAQTQVNALVTDLRQRFPVKETAGLRWRVEPMHQYVVQGVRPVLVALMGAVLFVLLIACANVANLMLVRTSHRERELTVRAALGSGRWALLRQTLVESFVLAAAGALLGVALAQGGIKLLAAIAPENLPRLDHIRVDRIVVAFTALATVLSALVFGLVPALRASRVNVAESLRTSGRSSALSGAGAWLRNGVVVAQVSLAFVLLVGSGLMMRSFVTMLRSPLGFDPGNVLTLQVPNQNQGRFQPGAAEAFAQQIQERLSGLPSVTGVTSTTSLPFGDGTGLARWGTEAAERDPTLFQQADFRFVRPNYFDVMRTRLLEGRHFTAADAVPEARIAIIDDVFARKAFPGQSAVGKRFLSRMTTPEPDWYEVIGVVQQQRNLSPAEESRETIYIPFLAANRWVIRTSGDPLNVAQAAHSEIKQLDRGLAIADVQPLQVLVDQARAPTRFALLCIAVFAIIAVFLASVGLYGVLSSAVRTRTAEIGMRMALGATSRNVFGLVVRQGAALSATGIVLGVLSAFWLTRLLNTLLVGVESTDPLTFAAIVGVFQVVALIACCVPALRAARLQPLIAIREE